MNTLDNQLNQELQEHKERGLQRSRAIVTTPPKPKAIINNQSFLSFCSNDYLGLANHQQVITAFQKAAKQYGVGSGSSHLINGHNHLHEKLEQALSTFTKREKTLCFSSGYSANIGVITALLNKQDAIFQDRLNHASLLDAGIMSNARLHRFLHKDINNLTQRLERTNARRKLIVSDGVFSMDGDTAPLKALVHTCQKHQAWLMIDDAHGFGCLGSSGGGLAEEMSLSQQELPILVGTLSKAFGTIGGFVSGSKTLIDYLIQFARTYIYTTALPPAQASATLTSLKLLTQEAWRREHLTHLISYFKTCCQQLDIPLLPSNTPIQPIMVGQSKHAMMMSKILAKKGIWVTAIRPPTVPKDSARLRITLSALHLKNHIDQLVSALKSAYQIVNRIKS